MFLTHLSFRHKRKSNQVVQKKRLLFDKINNEHLSTSDFLDSAIDPNHLFSNKHSRMYDVNFQKIGGFKMTDK